MAKPLKLSTATHDYDGTLVYTPSSLTLTLEEAIKKAGKAIEISKEVKKKGHALKTLVLLSGERGNYDPSSKIKVDDLFREVMANDPDPDLLTDILAEITTGGSCPQGRSTRLFQLLLVLRS